MGLVRVLTVALFSYTACAILQRHSKLPHYCSLAPGEGQCRAAYIKWYYNDTLRSCEKLQGCYVENVFESLQECNKKCRNKDYGGCAKLKNSKKCHQVNLKKGIWFDPDKKKCVQFYNETCENYRKIFSNERECYSFCGDFVQDRCLLPIVPATATCRHNEEPAEMFGYDRSTGQCVKFIYLSCGGNKNAFKSRAKCLETCNPNSTCLKHTQENSEWYRWRKTFYYNRYTDECRMTKTVLWKGLWPHENRFSTQEKCEKMCMPVHKPITRRQN